MGYTTTFDGEFRTDRPMAPEHRAYLKAFNETRRMKRDAAKAAARPDPVREATGLPVGDEGGYFVGAGGLAGQETEPRWSHFANDRCPVAADLLDSNEPPTGQPGLWCQWAPDEDDPSVIRWDDRGTIYVTDNEVEVVKDRIVKPGRRGK